MGKPPRRRRMRQVVARSSYPPGAGGRPTIEPGTPLSVLVLPAFGPVPAVPPRWQHSVELARALREALIVLGQLAAARDEARRVVAEHDERIRVAVARLRVTGANWGQIGGALGISRQGARQRFDTTAHAAYRTREDRTGANAPRDDVARGGA